MYKKVDCVVVSQSASAVNNNLTIRMGFKKAEEAAVIHRDTVCVVPFHQSVPNSTKCIRCTRYTNEKFVHVTQVEWYWYIREFVLIVTSTVGLQVFNPRTEECIFSHPCLEAVEMVGAKFARGIAIFTNGFYFCVGNSAGCVRLFGPPDIEGEITFVDRKQRHTYPIVDLSSSKYHMASADEEGYIVLWQREEEELVHKATVASKTNCTGIIFKRDWLLTTYGSGCVRFYGVNKETSSITLKVEIAAHAKSITGLDISENNEYLLTVSEDTYAKIWLLYKDGNFQTIKHVSNVPVRDNLLTGGKFLNHYGNKFCTTSYDTNIINCFAL